MNIKVGLFYGSETGNTRKIALEIRDLLVGTKLELADQPWDFSDLDVKFELIKLLDYQLIIIGSPTWNIGELQVDISEIFYQLDRLNFADKQVAFFGCGDQEGYPDTYQDALGIVGRKFQSLGARIVGRTEVEGNFENSQAIEEGKFMGLALDQENEAYLSTKRVRKWVDLLLQEMNFETINPIKDTNHGR